MVGFWSGVEVFLCLLGKLILLSISRSSIFFIFFNLLIVSFLTFLTSPTDSQFLSTTLPTLILLSILASGSTLFFFMTAPFPLLQFFNISRASWQLLTKLAADGLFSLSGSDCSLSVSQVLWELSSSRMSDLNDWRDMVMERSCSLTSLMTSSPCGNMWPSCSLSSKLTMGYSECSSLSSSMQPRMVCTSPANSFTRSSFSLFSFSSRSRTVYNSSWQSSASMCLLRSLELSSFSWTINTYNAEVLGWTDVGEDARVGSQAWKRSRKVWQADNSAWMDCRRKVSSCRRRCSDWGLTDIDSNKYEGKGRTLQTTVG